MERCAAVEWPPAGLRPRDVVSDASERRFVAQLCSPRRGKHAIMSLEEIVDFSLEHLCEQIVANVVIKTSFDCGVESEN